MFRFAAAKRVALTATVALLMMACGGGGGGSGSSSGDVNATLKDFGISLDKADARSGDVTFSVRNDGPSVHEFVVVRSNDAPTALPVKDGEVEEAAEGVTNVGEKEDIEPGSTASLHLHLDPGRYVLICNLPGHYGAGMHAALVVS